MANVYRSNSIYVDTTGSLVAKSVKVSYILFTPDAANDSIVIRDGTESSSPIKATLKGSTAKNTIQYDFSRRPLLFSAGIYVTIPTNGTATIVLTNEGESN